MKVFIETHGCEINKITTEILAKKLTNHELVKKEDAELIIINSCALNKEKQRKIIKSIKEHMSSKNILVMGCLPDIDPKSIETISPNISYMGTASLKYADEILKNIEEGKIVRRKEDVPELLINQEKANLENLIYNVPISEGCSNKCSFCVEPYTYGSMISYDPSKIINLIHSAVKHGFKEINLIGNEIASYGIDNSTKLPALLRKITIIPGNFKIKLGPMNPGNLIKIMDDLINSFSSSKIYKHLNIPLQSGSNEILKKMNREYTAEEFKLIISKFRQKYPTITISTDVMIGFPGETDTDYLKTKQLIKEIKPDTLNIYAYSKMPYTKAPETDVLSWKIKNRIDDLKNMYELISEKKKQEYIGWRGSATVIKHYNSNYSIARTNNYIDVIVEKSNLGEEKQIEITKYSDGLFFGM